ncbi:MAG: sulfurtransferase [Chloroflexi bacterium]|nr:sulfurtransferase [Chloroflexota bacterium]
MTDYAHPEALVNTQWVADHANDPKVHLIEVDVDFSNYQKGHIAGAVGFDWQKDLQAQPVRDMVSNAELEALLGKAGVSNDSTVVVYGDANNWFAAWALWVMKYYGHSDVRLMNGGRIKWEQEGRAYTTDVPTVTSVTYRGKGPDASLRALRDLVRESVGRADRPLVDVRSPREYSGELLAPENLPQEGAQRGGHIPGAQNIPWASAVKEDGTFKSADELAAIYQPKGVTRDKEVIAYCRIGERSAHTWYVLKYLLGYERVRNYDGSWTEWGSMVGVPIER